MVVGEGKAAGRVTMKDVAAKAGVSYKTVSNVVNGHDGQMTPATLQRVKQAMSELGYCPNHAAQALKTGRTGVVGLAMSGFGQPFLGYFADCAAHVTRRRGQALTIAMYEDGDEGLAQFLDTAPRLGADGWVVFTTRPTPANHPLFHQDYPIVLVGDYSAHGLIDSVTMPNVEAAQTATEIMIDKCGPDVPVAFVGAPLKDMGIGDGGVKNAMRAEEGNAELRFKAYMDALLQRGRTIDLDLIGSCESMDAPRGEAAMNRILDNVRSGKASMPGGVVCGNDALAIGVLSSLSKAGLKVPQDVQVLGFDNLPDGRFTVPPLSTIDPHAEQYAALAFDALLTRIGGEDYTSLPARILRPSFELLERGSTLR